MTGPVERQIQAGARASGTRTVNPAACAGVQLGGQFGVRKASGNAAR